MMDKPFTNCRDLLENQLRPIERKSPIRTVERREIVKSEATMPSGRRISISPGLDCVRLAIPNLLFDAADLREAARLFNEMADVLDEQKGNA